MPSQPVKLAIEAPFATISLNDPVKRNALGMAMFDALEHISARISADDSIHIVLLHGEGSAFCAGFDLLAAQKDPSLMPTFIHRLSALNRTLRRMPQVVVAAVHGAAIAGGCAMLSACDFVFVARDAKLGYPVHRLGISPAVTIPTLQQAIGAGAARGLLMSGELIDGAQAYRLGLASHLSPNSRTVLIDANAHCQLLGTKGPYALRITKAWLNQLDGSLSDVGFDEATRASALAAETDEARSMLQAWRAKPSPD